MSRRLFVLFNDASAFGGKRKTRALFSERRSEPFDFVLSLGGELHHLASHSVPVISERWRGAWRRFERRYLDKPFRLVKTGVLRERF